MSGSVNYVVYFYMFICVALLVYNILYIARSKGKGRTRLRREKEWLAELEPEWERVRRGQEVSPAHRRRMERKLRRIEELLAYHEAVSKGLAEDPDGLVQQYLDRCRLVFQALAVEYGKKPAMERAFYAYLISVYHPAREEGGGQLITVLLGYFEDSTVFCRENVLQALYAMGDPGAVERALELMSDRGWYHHNRLLSDGLAKFAGDREDLAWRMWRRCRGWEETFQVAVVQFATGVSSALAQEFFHALADETLPMETRFALLRYFQRHPYPPAKELMLDLLAQDEKGGLAIVAASALVRYPEEDTRRALLAALRSRNWHVRRNAAASLAALGAGWADAQALRDGGDRYAAEMLEYMLAEKGVPQPEPALAGAGQKGGTSL